MPRVVFTPNLQRHITAPAMNVSAATVREALEAVFAEHPRLRGYVEDDQGCLRKHMVIFVDGRPVLDRHALQDLVSPSSEIYVMQALSGG